MKYFRIGTLIVYILAGISFRIINDTSIIRIVGFILLGFIPLLIGILKLKVPKFGEISLMIFLFLALGLGSNLLFYEKFAHFDLLLHGSAGFFMSLLMLWIIKTQKIVVGNFFRSFFIVFASAGAAALWEIFEFIYDEIDGIELVGGMQRREFNVIDTMHDLLIHTVVALIFSTILYFDYKHKKIFNNALDKLFK